MEILPSLTAELKEKLTNATDLATQESIIYQHISAIENKKFIFPQFPAGM